MTVPTHQMFGIKWMSEQMGPWIPAAAKLLGKTEITALKALVYLQETIPNLSLDHL